MRQTSRVLSTKILRSSWTSANKYLLAMPVYHFSFKWNLGLYRHRCIVVAMAVRCPIITRSKEVTFYNIEYLFQRRSSDGFVDWTFSTVRCWGEKPQGTWQLIVIDNGTNQSYVLCAFSHVTFYCEGKAVASTVWSYLSHRFFSVPYFYCLFINSFSVIFAYPLLDCSVLSACRCFGGLHRWLFRVR